MATNDASSGPKRGEIWRVNLAPVVGSEMDKTRPAVVISSDAVGVLSMRLVVPVTSWKSWYEDQIWHVRLRPTEQNGLSKESAADALQIRGVDTSRFAHRMGRIASMDLENVIAAIAALLNTSSRLLHRQWSALVASTVFLIGKPLRSPRRNQPHGDCRRAPRRPASRCR